VHGRSCHCASPPSLQGYEARLLFDEFRNRTSRSITGFIAAGGKDYTTAIATMRANQFLMEQREATLIYYSLRDGINKLSRAVECERVRAASSAGRGEERLVVVAPVRTEGLHPGRLLRPR
jgi:hypothetical protein